jgi:hypothetical protein
MFLGFGRSLNLMLEVSDGTAPLEHLNFGLPALWTFRIRGQRLDARYLRRTGGRPAGMRRRVLAAVGGTQERETRDRAEQRDTERVGEDIHLYSVVTKSIQPTSQAAPIYRP